jgi:proline iminopeptidase
MVGAYYRRLTSPRNDVRRAAARAWSVWEGSTSTLLNDPDKIKQAGEDRFAEAFARIECHYFLNKGFFELDGYLLDQATRFQDIPATIVQGRYDMVCPIKSAWDLSNKWPGADLIVIGNAGHAYSETGTLRALIQAVDAYAAPA